MNSNLLYIIAMHIILFSFTIILIAIIYVNATDDEITILFLLKENYHKLQEHVICCTKSS